MEFVKTSILQRTVDCLRQIGCPFVGECCLESVGAEPLVMSVGLSTARQVTYTLPVHVGIFIHLISLASNIRVSK